MENKALSFFFSLGDKVTKGDALRKARFDYYLLWIIFLAFLTVSVGNFNQFWQTGQISYLGWGIVILGILWFQYFTLKSSYQGVKLLEQFMSNQKQNKDSKIEEKIESENEMLKGFEENKENQEAQKIVDESENQNNNEKGGRDA